MRRFLSILSLLLSTFLATAQQPPAEVALLYQIAAAPDAERIEQDIRRLVSFGTRNTLSDTTSETRGIGAARRWVKAEFDRISDACDGCLEVRFERGLITSAENPRIPRDVMVVNVIATLRGRTHPDRYVIMSGDIDSRASIGTDAETDAPGANDNASGVAGLLEAARVLSQHEYASSIVFAALSGEEQGLFGGKIMAANARQDNWDIVGVLNNDMIGNIRGIDGVIDNSSFRVFSEPTPATDDLQKQTWRRFYGGEVDGPSRQLARYVDQLTRQYCTNLDAKMIYRLDRFGRGGHHRPFNDEGFAGVRIMETHEDYDRQHQDLRTEDGVEYGDVIERVDFDYAAKLTGVNAIVLAALASAPPQPSEVRIGGVVRPSTYLEWDMPDTTNVVGYKVHWRETTSPTWDHHRFVGQVNSYTLENIIIDNYLFGVSAISRDGYESVVVYPSNLVRRR